MAIKALTFGEQYDYISKLDPGIDEDNDEKATVWKLGVIDALLLADIEDDAYEFALSDDGGDDDAPKSTTTKLHINRRNVVLVQHGLRGWSNFVDDEGNEVKYKTKSVTRNGRATDVLSDALISLIPPLVIKELAEELLNKNSMTALVVKN